MSSKKHISFFLFVVFSLTFAISDTEKKQFQELLKSSKYQNSFTHPLDTLSKTSITNYFNIDENKIIKIVPDSLLPKMSTESLLDSLLLHPIGWDQLENQSENLFLLSITPFFFNVTYELLSREVEDRYNWRLMVKVREFIPQINFLLSHSFILEKLRKYSWQSFDSIIDYIRRHNKNNVLPISAYPLVVNIIRNDNIYKIDLEDENSLTIKDINKSGGIDTLVHVLDNYLHEKYRFIDRDESYPVKTVKTATGDISYYRNKTGDIDIEYGGVGISHGNIYLDSLGNELVIDNNHKTGLSIDEYFKHRGGYNNRVSSILNEKGMGKGGRVRDWYEKRINLDSLDQLKAIGFDPYPYVFNEVPKNIDNFLYAAFWSKAIIIGEVLESDNIPPRVTRYNCKYKIKIDEIIKSSPELINKSVIECDYLYDDMHTGKAIIPINTKAVIFLMNAQQDKLNAGLLRMATWYDINGGNVTYNKNYLGWNKERIMPLNEFKSTVIRLLEINDADNFFKRSWIKK
ncbi:MAG TPA: hypothetical protein PLK90_09265 [Clostridiales bacterium]|nr:hypothetical protein [Clostridiales bacterium]HQP70575.1 hypothetical protein [Clostridiales bacterium]